ncbi:MAG: riboflavin biosynthesis pyrimidine reductase, partial [Limisphaerales bacterium]
MSAPPQPNARRPFVLINMAMTADGKIATANGSVSTFGSARDQQNLLDLRATADAVMAGARTVDAHPVTLGPGGPKFRRRRVRNGLAESNLRVVVSGSGSLNPNAAIFDANFSPLIVIASESASERKLSRLRKKGADVQQFGKNEIDFVA